MKNKLLLLCCVIVPCVVHAQPELKGSPDELSQYLLDEKKLVTLVGVGEQRVEADTARVYLLVKTKDGKFHDALEKNKSLRSAIKKKLETAAIGADRIIFSKFSSVPGYGWFGDKPTSYEVSNEINVSISKEDEMLVIAEIIDTMPAVFFGRTEIKHSKKSEAKAAALEKSLQDVSTKKLQYEKSLGIKLFPVRIVEQAVQENQQGLRRTPAKYQTQSNILASGINVAEVNLEQDTDNAGGFGELLYHAQTTIVYTIK
jgi:hypothetical protein